MDEHNVSNKVVAGFDTNKYNSNAFDTPFDGYIQEVEANAYVDRRR